MLRSLVAALLLPLISVSPAKLSADDAAPKKVALLVGVEKYLKPGFDDLEYCEDDVRAVGDELKKLGFEVTVLLGSGKDAAAATKENIEATTRRLVRPLGKRDVMLIMLSGHGQTLNPDPHADPNALEVDQFESYYCPFDAEYNTPGSQVSINFLLDKILATNVGRKLLLLDACRDIPVDRSKPGKNSRGINAASIDVRTGTSVYLSCSFGQRSFEDAAKGHGLFTDCLLDGLRGGAAKDGELTWVDLIGHVNRRMRSPEILKLMPPNEPQVPFPAGDLTDMVLGRIEERSPAGLPNVSVRPSTSVDLRYVDQDGALAVVLRPAQTLNNPVVMGVIRSIEAVNPDFKLADRLQEMREELGVDLHEIDHVLVVCDQQQLSMVSMLLLMMMEPQNLHPGDGDGPMCDGQVSPSQANGESILPQDSGDQTQVPPPLVIVRFNRSVDPQKFTNAGVGSTQPRTHKGQAYYVKADETAMWFQDPATVVIASEPQVQSLIAGKFGAPGELAAILEPLAAHELALAVDVRQLHDLLGMMAQQNPVAAMAGGLVKQVNTLTLAADLQGPNLLQFQLLALNDGSAAGLQAMLGGFLQQGQQVFVQQTTEHAGDLGPEQLALLPLAKQLVSGASVTADGSICRVTLPRPQGLEQLPELIGPALQRMQADAVAAGELFNLHQIGLAFHSYHDVYGCFPAHGGPGDAGRLGERGAGLSWRVHLLQFLDSAPLYNEFHLDEPWDSAHNQTLIARMPALYGDNAEGKTSLHVFVGPGTPFEGDVGVKPYAIPDGSSNTLLVVQAGPSTAEIWTKPGGLTLNAANPIATLGDIGATFNAVMMDASARQLPAAIDGETLRNLVNPQDGNPVQIP